MNNIIKHTVKSNVFLVSAAMLVFIISASFIPKQTEWKAPESAKNVKNPIPADATAIAAGKTVYVKECLQCHGKKGLGDGPNAATLDKSPEPLNTAKVKDQTDGELFWKIKQGKKPMPSTSKTLTDDQRWQVVDYIRTFNK